MSLIWHKWRKRERVSSCREGEVHWKRKGERDLFPSFYAFSRVSFISLFFTFPLFRTFLPELQFKKRNNRWFNWIIQYKNKIIPTMWKFWLVLVLNVCITKKKYCYNSPPCKMPGFMKNIIKINETKNGIKWGERCLLVVFLCVFLLVYLQFSFSFFSFILVF